jgi:hypothetical protein
MVVRELGYPSREALDRWYRESKQSGGLHVGYQKRHKFSAEQKQIAVEYNLKHGRRLARTVRALGYLSRTLLAADLSPEFRTTDCWKFPQSADSASG